MTAYSPLSRFYLCIGMTGAIVAVWAQVIGRMV